LRGAPIPAFGLVPWTHPHITVKKQIVRFDAEGGKIWFEDSSHIDEIDHIIFGSGYTFSFPFLPVLQEQVKRAYRRLPGVYQHTFNIDDPSLVFIGMVSFSPFPSSSTNQSSWAEASPSKSTNTKPSP
jgi:Flavin-binding monooxygenase-like